MRMLTCVWPWSSIARLKAQITELELQRDSAAETLADIAFQLWQRDPQACCKMGIYVTPIQESENVNGRGYDA
jgi:hypothetical protein